MKNIPQFLLRCSVFAVMPFAAHAAGTYYTGAYQYPQQRYMAAQTAQAGVRTGTYAPTSYASMRYNQPTRATTAQTGVQSQSGATNATNAGAKNKSGNKSGFFVDAGISREMASWNFEMQNAKSVLRYDDISWNVFDVRGGYAFDLGNTPVQIDAGFKYGMQSGDASMTDDDISNGGAYVQSWPVNDKMLDQYNYGLSIGRSGGGNMYGFNVGFGLTDFFKIGNVKMTPSVGYRYFKYKLETEGNDGIMVDVVNNDGGCTTLNGETVCGPAIIIYTLNANNEIASSTLLPTNHEIPSNTEQQYVDANTIYFHQAGVSHSYEVEWSGPYVALDMDYAINQNNAVNGHVELGLPGYKSVGDQPYRADWAHPKSVEDKAGIGSAFHFGLGANWTTAITANVALSIGLTYDYYKVSDADAYTYQNGTYYTNWYNDRLTVWNNMGYSESDMLNGIDTNGDGKLEVKPDEAATFIKDMQESCPGWVCKADGEIESFYKSMGIRVGINAKF